jgi:transposase-like protein
MSNKNKRYHSPEFKSEAVKLVKSKVKPIAAIARDLGIADSLLHAWLRKDREARERGISVEVLSAEQSEMVRLRQENLRLQEEVSILKKATAYFAKEVM